MSLTAFVRDQDRPCWPCRQRPQTRTPALVVIGAGTILFSCFGSAYAIPVFFPVLSKALAVPLPHFTAVFSAAGALYFSLGVASGPLADRIGPRTVAALGSAVLACGLLVASHATNEYSFDVGYLLGVGGGVGLCFVPAVGAVQAACRAKPAVAGGVAASGIGMGTLVLPSLTQLLIDHVGPPQALEALALLAGCGGVAALLLPSARNMNGGSANRAGHEPDRAGAAQSSRFVLLYAAQLTISLVAFVPFAHLVIVARAMGWSAATGGYLIGLIGVGSLCGRILLSFIAQSHGSCRAAGLCAVMMAVSLALLSSATQPWQFAGIAALYGLGYGGVIGLTGPIIAEVLGTRRICGSVGVVTTSRALGILIGPWGVGLMAHRLGNYEIPFLFCAALALIASVLLSALHRGVAAPQPSSLSEPVAAFWARRGGTGTSG